RDVNRAAAVIGLTHPLARSHGQDLHVSGSSADMRARRADSAGSVLREGTALGKLGSWPTRAGLADGEHLLFSLNLSPVHFLTCIRSARPDVSQPLHERLEFQGTFGLTNIFLKPATKDCV